MNVREDGDARARLTFMPLVEHEAIPVHDLQPTRPPSSAALAPTMPFANTAPSGPASSTASPGSNSPSHRTMPTPRSDAPFSTRACRAPASTCRRPAVGLPKRNQSLKADSLRSAAVKRVPRASPARMGARTTSPRPSAITVGIPAAAYLRGDDLAAHAAATEGRPLPSTSPARAPSARSSAPGFSGARVYTPSTSVRSTSRLARTSTRRPGPRVRRCRRR